MSQIIGRYVGDEIDVLDTANELEAAGAEVFSITKTSMLSMGEPRYCVWAKINIIQKYPDDYLRNAVYKRDLVDAIQKVHTKDDID